MTEADYENGQALLTVTPVKVEFRLHHLEQTARSIGIYVNSNTQSSCVFHKKKSLLRFKWQEISRKVNTPGQKYLIY